MKSGRCNVNCQHSSKIFVFPQSTCWHGDFFELCMSCLLSVDSSCFWSCILSVTSIIAFAQHLLCQVGLILDAASQGWRKRQRFKTSAPHCTALHWGQHWPTGGTTADIEQASLQWIWNRQMVHELRCWVHPGFNFASPGLQDFWFLLFLHVSMFVYSWLLIFWIWLNLIWHQQVILWWVHLKWGDGVRGQN